MPEPATYTGRFAPSPTGPLHLGSVVAALASWLDARAYGLRYGQHRQQWLVRMEDTDRHRCQAGAGEEILRQLHALGLTPDGAVLWQSRNEVAYQQALQRLQETGMAYACCCTRKQIEQALAASGHERHRFNTLAYPGTCRHAKAAEPVRAWRFRTDVQLVQAKGWGPAQHASPTGQALAVPMAQTVTNAIRWQDRRLGWQQQQVEQAVGDFVLLRADGMWSYQLACVVDDAGQGVTHIVRGEDLLDNTARQILLQQALGLARPRYLHIPLAVDGRGEKLSKSNGAAPVAVETDVQALAALGQAAGILGLGQATAAARSQALLQWMHEWAAKYPL